MTRLLILFLMPLFALPVLGQDLDSLTFVHQKWKQQRVKKGIVWKEAHFESLFGGRQAVNLIEIDLRKHHKKLKMAGVSLGTKRTSEFARENDALVAINGGFFNTKIGGAVDFIQIDGQVVNESTNKSPRANAYFAFDKTGVFIIPRTDDSVGQRTIANMMLSGPLLLAQGKEVTLDDNKFNQNKHPRTALALKNNTLILLTVDGRNAMSHGVSLPELSKLLQWYGSQDAMNLDGGGSTTMYVTGQPDNGVVNYPSDNKQFDHQGERPVANIIYIRK